MTYALMLWTIVACGAYYCERDWRQVATFEGNPGAKILCEEAGKTLFDGKKYQCVRTSMTIWEILMYAVVFAVVVWWAMNANFAPCEKCNYDCNQGRRCPHK